MQSNHFKSGIQKLTRHPKSYFIPGPYCANLPSSRNLLSNGAEIFIQMRRIERERRGEERGRSVPKSNGAFSLFPYVHFCICRRQREYKRDICYFRGRKHMLRSANLIHWKPDVKYIPICPRGNLLYTYLLLISN